jgi:MFS family permease
MTQLLMGRLIDRFSLPRLYLALSALQPIGLAIAALSSGVPLLLGLVLTMAAIYGQVVINDAVVARYVPATYRSKAFSVRYFLGFTVSGFVVPMIVILHKNGGFALVLGVAAVLGAVVLSSAIAFYWLTNSDTKRVLAPAE